MTRAPDPRSAPLAFVVWGVLRGYQLFLSPLKPGPSCRFHPTCSHYGLEAILHHGVWVGLGLTVRRLARCHPWGGSGYDPVPPVAPPPASSLKEWS